MEYVIDGRWFWTVRGFLRHFGRRVIPNSGWGYNLDAFNDVLRGGFGTPDGGFTLRWKNHSKSRRRLGNAQFEDLVSLIRNHGPGGDESDDGVQLILE
jgi:RNAse (barnase) inhibitor barstar